LRAGQIAGGVARREYIVKQIFFNKLRGVLGAVYYVRRSIAVGFLYKR
jgi:hypothetical protein